MKATKLIFFCYGIFLLFSTLCGGEVADKKMVWAHHTPWYRPEDYSLFTTWFYNYPLQETVNNSTIRIDSLKEEFRVAKAAGIDGLFLDLSTDPNRGPFHWSFILKDYLKAAEGTDFQIGICLDGWPRGLDYQIKETTRIIKEYSKHPNYPTYEGKSIVFAYNYNPPKSWKPEEWQAIRKAWADAGLDVFLIANLAPWPNRSIDLNKEEMYKDTFDAVFMFDSPAHANDSIEYNNNVFKKFCDDNGKMFVPNLHPGYYSEWIAGNDFYNPFRGGDFLYYTWKAASKMNAQWFHLTTWNDMMETACLERAYTFGIIDSVRYYCFNLKGIDFKYKDPKILLAYHREELPGTLLRIEALSFPSQNNAPVTLSGNLLDLEGKRVAKLPPRKLKAGTVSRAEWLIPTANLASSPVLIPELTASAGNWKKSVKAPAVMLITSWLQNAVTMNIPMDRLMDFPHALKVTQKGNILTANVTFDAPEKIKRITLFKNDRPVGIFLNTLKKGEAVLNFRIASDIALNAKNGRILCGLKKGAHFKGFDAFKYKGSSLFSIHNSGGLAVSVAGTPDMVLNINRFLKKKQYSVTPGDLVEKRIIRDGDFFIETAPDGTLLLSEPLNISKGNMELNLFAVKPRFHDSYYVRFDSVDGNVLFSAPIFPFGSSKSVSRPILETPVTLETRLWCMLNTPEFFTPQKYWPVKSNKVVNVPVSLLSNRTAHWNFDGSGTDTGSEHYSTPLMIPPEHFINGGFDGKGQALRFDGKTQIKLRHIAWPIGGTGTTTFYLKPDAFKGKKQSVIYKSGWQDGLCINLLENGRVEVVRVYAAGMTEKLIMERFSGKTQLTPGKWNKVEIKGDAAMLRLFVNGKEDGSMKFTPQRRYGLTRVFLGGGMKGYEKYSGLLDELTLSGF